VSPSSFKQFSHADNPACTKYYLYPTGSAESQPTFDGSIYEPLSGVPYAANSGCPNGAPNQNASAPNVKGDGSSTCTLALASVYLIPSTCPL